MSERIEFFVGRCLLAVLFAAGAVQKALDPVPGASAIDGCRSARVANMARNDV